MIDPKHIDAMARVIDPAAFDVDSLDWLSRAVIEGPALDLLTSTDPDVHAAMLDALTRHGVLDHHEELDCYSGCLMVGIGHGKDCTKFIREWYSTEPECREVTP